jgi:hypothetical protein
MIDTSKIAVFLLPKGACKELTSIGWEFESENPLPADFVADLMSSLCLVFDKSFLGIDVYRNEKIQANVEKADSGMVEFVYFQCQKASLDELKTALNTAPNAEVFIPSIDANTSE